MKKASIAVALGLIVPAAAYAQVPRPAASAARPTPSASAAASAPAGALPPGHPRMDDGDDDMPPGHGENPHGGNPHGGAPHGGDARGLREAPQNTTAEDPTLPRGTVVIEVLSPDDKPIPSQEVTIGVVDQSISKGESRRRVTQLTGPEGRTTFEIPEATSETAVRISVVRDGATSAAPPFRLPQKAGMRVIVYSFPVVREASKAQVAMQGILYIEPRDEVLQIEGAYRIYNLGQTAWLATNEEVTLPATFKAFTSQKGMDDLSWDGTKTGATFRGTVPPGMHETAYRFQIPLDGQEEMSIDLGLLPNVQSYRVIAESPKGATLEVEGFPPAITTNNGNGQRILVSERTTDRVDPTFRRVKLRFGGLPTRSKGRWVAVILAISAAAGGLWAAMQLRVKASYVDPAELVQARELLLSELTSLEKARAANEIGPKTYQRVREELLGALARLLAHDDVPKAEALPVGYFPVENSGASPGASRVSVGHLHGRPQEPPRSRHLEHQGSWNKIRSKVAGLRGYPRYPQDLLRRPFDL